MKSFLEEYAYLKEETAHLPLGQKLAAIGSLYLECHPSPEYFGPFYYHTSQLPAKLLSLLADASDERAYSSLIALLYALPSKGGLSTALIECISSQRVMSEHQPRTGPRVETYYPLICVNIVSSYNGSNWSVADALFSIGKLPHHHRLKTNTDDTLANRLADVGETYLQKYPKPTSMLGFFDRHYNQNHAHLLVQLKGMGEIEAMQRAMELLAGLGKGSLSQAIMDEVGRDHGDEITKARDNVDEIGDLESQFADAMFTYSEQSVTLGA